MHFLIVKLSAYGDIVQSYPTLTLLKSRFPDCTIDWVVEKQMQSLVTTCPLVDNVIEIDLKGARHNLFNMKHLRNVYSSIKTLREKKYDVLFDLQGNCKSALVTFLARAKEKVGFGYRSTSEWLNPLVTRHHYNPPNGLTIYQDYQYFIQKYFDLAPVESRDMALTLTESEQNQLANYQQNSWLVCPGSNWKNKKLSLHTLTQFLSALTERYHPSFVFLCGSPTEKTEAELLSRNFPGSVVFEKPTLALLQHCMQRSQVVISMDSLPLHLAATTSTPTFSIFGPSASTKYAPSGNNHKAIQGHCPYGEQFLKRCTKLRTCPTGACMHDLDPNKLFTEFQQFFQKFES